MAMTATTNTSANTALRYLDINSRASSSSLAKLSSGSRIVRASDDAASLAVGTKLKADVTALKQAQVNASQASSVLQVADGALAQTVDILMRMKALSVQAQSGSVSDNERGFLDKEFEALAAQINSIAEQTKFNGTKLLTGALTAELDATAATSVPGTIVTSVDGSTKAGTYTLDFDQASNAFSVTFDGQTYTTTLPDNAVAPATNQFTGSIALNGLPGISFEFNAFDLTADLDSANPAVFSDYVVTNGALDFQVGVASSDTIAIDLPSIETDSMGNYKLSTATLADSAGDGSNVAASISTQDNAVVAGDILDDAISQLNEYRADVGARISRFEFASANLATTIENLDASRSVLLDVDMAAEMSNFSSKQVLLQASVAMLAQANQQPQQLLKLLG